MLTATLRLACPPRPLGRHFKSRPAAMVTEVEGRRYSVFATVTGSPVNAGTRARDAAPIMHERVAAGRPAPETWMRRAPPEWAKLTPPRTGPPRPPQLPAARATCESAATSPERLGPPLLALV